MLDLVEHDESSTVLQRCERALQLAQVARVLEVEDQGVAGCVRSHLTSKRRLAHLTRPEQGYTGGLAQESLDHPAMALAIDGALWHTLKIGILGPDFQVYSRAGIASRARGGSLALRTGPGHDAQKDPEGHASGRAPAT